MQTNLKITIKCVYGNELIYPACEQSKKLASLLGTKTFTRAKVEELKAIGFSFMVVLAAAAI